MVYMYHSFLIITGDWNAKVQSKEISRATGKSGLGVQSEAGQKLTVLPREHMVIAKTLFQQHKTQLHTWTSPDGQYRNQTDYILCREDGEVLYSQQKQDQELTMAQIISSLLQNSGSN